MKGRTSAHKGKQSIDIDVSMIAEFISACPKCGGEIELWSEEQETVCIFCEHKIFDREKTTH